MKLNDNNLFRRPPQNHEIHNENKINSQRDRKLNRTQFVKQEKAHKKKKMNRMILFSIYATLLIVSSCIGYSILQYTAKRSQTIEHSKITQTDLNPKGTDTKKSLEARNKFDNVLSKIKTGKNDSDIIENADIDDIRLAKKYLSQISNKFHAKYQAKYDVINEKITIQKNFNKMFDDGDLKHVKSSVIPSKIFEFNSDTNPKIQRMINNDIDDEFAIRMNQQQNKLTSDAKNILNIYQDTTNLYSQLGEKDNQWTFKLKNDVVTDDNVFTKDRMSLLTSGSSTTKVQSLADVKKRIESLNYNWDSQLKFVNVLLNNSNAKAQTNYDNLAKEINAAIDKKNAEDLAKQQELRRQQELARQRELERQNNLQSSNNDSSNSSVTLDDNDDEYEYSSNNDSNNNSNSSENTTNNNSNSSSSSKNNNNNSSNSNENNQNNNNNTNGNNNVETHNDAEN